MAKGDKAMQLRRLAKGQVVLADWLERYVMSACPALLGAMKCERQEKDACPVRAETKGYRRRDCWLMAARERVSDDG